LAFGLFLIVDCITSDATLLVAGVLVYKLADSWAMGLKKIWKYFFYLLGILF
jgi:hypothetical protein